MGTLKRRGPQLPQKRYGVALTEHSGGTVKLVWLLAALLLTALTIGGVMSATKDGDTASLVGDLVISALLGAGAITCWKRTSN